MHDFKDYSPYSKDDIIKAVHGIDKNRIIKFRYEILNELNQKIEELDNVLSGEISCDNDSTIKKSLKLSYRSNGKSLTFYKLRPIVSFFMSNNTFLDFPQGIYIMGDVSKKEVGNSIVCDIIMFDEIKRLENEKTDYRYYFPAGTLYYDAITELLNKLDIVDISIAGAHRGQFDIEYISDSLTIEREWEIGKSYLDIIRDLLRDINYTDIWTNENGVFKARKQRTIDELPVEYCYSDDNSSIQFNGIENSSDYFDIPNRWILTVSNPDSLPLVSILENQADIVFRGQTITKLLTIDYIANKDALDEYVKQIAEMDKVTETVEFETAIVPFHDVNDVFIVQNKTHNINFKYQESRWLMPLKIGAKMKHEVLRKVNIYD